LDLIVNEVLNILLPVERPLAMSYLNKFDSVIGKSMNWKSKGISDFIVDSMEHHLTMKNNLRGVNE